MIVGVINQKGGAGKTTLVVNLAGALANRGDSTCIIDTDPQGSVLQWQSINETAQLAVVHKPGGKVKREIRTLSPKYDHIIIDSPPALEQTTVEVLKSIEVAIVPVTPSPLDIWSANETLNLIKAIQRRNKKLSPKLLVYRRVPGTRIGRQAREALKNYGFPVLRTEITQRIAYVEAMNTGLSVADFAPRSMAAAEIHNLVEELG
jgi:chromosome partitioning protein